MTIAFMALLASVLGERISPRAGTRGLWPLLIVGAASTLHWQVGEQRGHGDLRPYALVQFGSMVLIPLTLALFPARYTGRRISSRRSAGTRWQRFSSTSIAPSSA
jgi:hypothetical protein